MAEIWKISASGGRDKFALSVFPTTQKFAPHNSKEASEKFDEPPPLPWAPDERTKLEIKFPQSSADCQAVIEWII